MKMRKIAAAVLLLSVILLICLFLLPSCMYGNSRADVSYCAPQETDAELRYPVDAGLQNYYLSIDKTSGEVKLNKTQNESVSPEREGLVYPVVLDGNDFPRYGTKHAEGYENLAEMLTARYKKDGVKYLQYYAVEYDGGNKTAYGFCNLYSSAKGMLSGGGQIDVAKTVAGVYFKFNSETGEFTEIARLEKCNIVACNTQSVVYFNNRKYYACAAGGEPKYLCDDEAYDKGINHTS